MSHPQPTAAAGGWGTLALTIAIQAMVSMAAVTLPVMAPPVAAALGVPVAVIGLYMTAVYIGAMLASLASGAIVGRFGAIRVSQGGLVLVAAGLLLCAVPSWPAAALGAFLIGLGYGPITPASSHLLAQSTPPHRMSLVFSIKQTGVPVGGMLAGAVVPALVLLVGWQGALLAVAAASLVCAVAAQPLRPVLDADRDPARPLALGQLGRPIRMVLDHPPLKVLAGCSFVFSIAQSCLTAYLVSHLHQGFGWSLVGAGLALSLAQAGGIAGRVLWGHVADRWTGARPLLAALAGVMAVCALATAMLDTHSPQAAVLLVAFVFGASAIGWNGVYLAEVARRAPAGQASLATGGTLTFTFLGAVIGPPLFGAAAGAAGTYAVAFGLLAIPTLACGFVLWRSVQRPRLPADV